VEARQWEEHKIWQKKGSLGLNQKHDIAWGFFVNISIYLSIYPFFATPTGRIFSAILTFDGSYDVFLQPSVPFGGRVKTTPI